MTWLSAIIMGLVQGIAEFLPISSSGHLAIAEHLLNMQGASEIPQFYDVLPTSARWWLCSSPTGMRSTI